MTRRKYFLAATICAVTGAATFALTSMRTQESAPQPVHWTAKFQPSASALHRGAKVKLMLSAEIDAGWHVYASSQPPGSPVVGTQITVPDGQPLSLSGEIDSPEPQTRMDPTTGKSIDLYEGSARFTLPLKAAKNAMPGKHTFEVDVRFQACNDRLCLLPRTQNVKTPITIASRR